MPCIACLVCHLPIYIHLRLPGPQTGPNASTSKHATRSVSQPRSSAPFGRSSLASGAATPTRQSQSAIKRLPSRQGSSATTDSVSVLTHQASIATAALRREQAAFNGSDSRTGRAASASPGKSTGPSKSQDANAQSMFRYIVSSFVNWVPLMHIPLWGGLACLAHRRWLQPDKTLLQGLCTWA